MKRLIAVIGLLLLQMQTARAVVWISIPDVSQLQYQTNGDGKIYFRNINQFNGSAMGCCYNYWIDTNTVEGRNIFALILSHAALHTGLLFGLTNDWGAGAVSGVGEW